MTSKEINSKLTKITQFSLSANKDATGFAST